MTTQQNFFSFDQQCLLPWIYWDKCQTFLNAIASIKWAMVLNPKTMAKARLPVKLG
jgi:hypothetical protein